jgi:hypothetical protein
MSTKKPKGTICMIRVERKVLDALRMRKEATGIPIGRLVEDAVAAFLIATGGTKPGA